MGHEENREGEIALKLLARIRLQTLLACAISAFKGGDEDRTVVDGFRNGLTSSIYFAKTLLEMYVRQVWKWDALGTVGYSDNAENELALPAQLSTGYLAALKACANMVAVAAGREVHVDVRRN